MSDKVSTKRLNYSIDIDVYRLNLFDLLRKRTIGVIIRVYICEIRFDGNLSRKNYAKRVSRCLASEKDGTTK